MSHWFFPGFLMYYHSIGPKANLVYKLQCPSVCNLSTSGNSTSRWTGHFQSVLLLVLLSAHVERFSVSRMQDFSWAPRLWFINLFLPPKHFPNRQKQTETDKKGQKRKKMDRYGQKQTETVQGGREQKKTFKKIPHTLGIRPPRSQFLTKKQIENISLCWFITTSFWVVWSFFHPLRSVFWT